MQHKIMHPTNGTIVDGEESPITDEILEEAIKMKGIVITQIKCEVMEKPYFQNKEMR